MSALSHGSSSALGVASSSQKNGINGKTKKSSNSDNRANKHTSATEMEEEKVKTAIMLRNRDLEIYVTLPSAEKRLFVDVQEELSLFHASSSSHQNDYHHHHHQQQHKSKKAKTDQSTQGDKNVPSRLSISAAPNSSTSGAPTAVSVSASSRNGQSSSHRSSGNQERADTTSRNSAGPLQVKDANAPPSGSNASKSAHTRSSEKGKENNATFPSSSRASSATSAPLKEQPRLPYATFEQVKLNVRVKPSNVGEKNRLHRKEGTGVNITTLPKKIAPPKIVDRFPIRIIGSTTRPTALACLQDTFDLSVQGCTDIAAVLVLLYTRLKSAHEDNFQLLNLNAIRLWHLDEDRLVRLSNGTVASNGITAKSLLCYTISKRLGKSHVFVYADASKVERIELDIEMSRMWKSKEQTLQLEESKPPNAPRRQLLKLKQDLPTDSTHEGTNEAQSRHRQPHVTSFSMSLLAELDETPTPMQIALETARQEHEQRQAERENARARREEERRKEIDRLENVRKRLQKNRKNVGTGENLGNDGFVAVHSISENADTEQSAVAAGQAEEPDSEWYSEDFVEEWLDNHDPLDDGCDDDLPFDPKHAVVEMASSVLLTTSVSRQPLVPMNSSLLAENESNAEHSPIPTVHEGVHHILSALAVPTTARKALVEDMVKATSAYPYIAVTLVETVDLACALNLEAKYRPLDDPSCYWDTRDIQQVCLLYRGIWKSELEDWKRGCKNLTTIDWKKMTFGANWTVPAAITSVTAATTTATASAHVAGASVATAAPVPPASSAGSAASSAGTSTASLTPQARFNEYRLRTHHRRNRLCPVCQSEGCNHSRETSEGAESDDDEPDDIYGDEYYKNYVHAGHQPHTEPAPNGAARHEETVASVLIPGHRARVVQCIFMETF